jgi:hypothetical protein
MQRHDFRGRNFPMGASMARQLWLAVRFRRLSNVIAESAMG